MIPRLIHQTAKTADIPEKWRAYQRKVQSLHPDWTYRLWTDEDNLALVKSDYPDLLEIYLKLPKNIMRADVARYLILHKFGGLYLDLDYEMLKPFDLTQHNAVLPWESEGEFGAGNDKLCNCFMACAPGHPFFRRLIDELKAHPPLNDDADVEASTGPIFVTRTLRQAAGADLSIFSPPRELFCPPPPQTMRACRAIIDRGVAYGIHHCSGSWREYTFAQLVRIYLGQAMRQVLGQQRVENSIRRHGRLASLLGVRR